MPLLATLDGFFAHRAPIEPGDGLVVGFSGGPDSSALLSALARWSRGRRLTLTAAHLDHALDPGSAARARGAAAIAARLDIACVSVRRPVAAQRRQGENLEAAARRVRYRFLEAVRLEKDARYVATAHHRDDQAETVVLRMRQGTGLGGLAAIAPRRGPLVRPLLDLPRSDLADWLARHGPEPTDDPTNHDLARRRNLVRHQVLPALRGESTGDLAADLARLAGTAATARRAIDRRLERALAPRATKRGVEIDRLSFERLPKALHQPALAWLHRLAGAAHPPPAGARRELARQLERGAGGRRVGIDTGAGWALTSRGNVLVLQKGPLVAQEGASVAAPFAYTLAVPGELKLPAGVGTLRISRRAVEPWMFETSTWRAGLFLELAAGERITVRSRRPGDRIRPIGCSYHRRLKEVLIDRKVPRHERDRLPLLCVGERVVWVPGVAVAEECRLSAIGPAWAVEWER